MGPGFLGKTNTASLQVFFSLTLWIWNCVAWSHKMFVREHLLNLEVKSFMNSAVILYYCVLKF